MSTAKPTPAQRRMLENVKAGRSAHHGFMGGKSASVVLGNVIERGWLAHTMKTTGPAFFLTAAGAEALART
jgi:hypothetical protein